MTELIQRLRDEMYRRKMNQAGIARLTGVNGTTLSFLLRGERKPTERTLEALAKHLEWKDGIYKEYYYGIPDEEAEAILQKVADKRKEFGLTVREMIDMSDFSMRAYRMWTKKMTPEGKRKLLAFIETTKEELFQMDNVYAEVDKRAEELELTKAKVAHVLGVDVSTYHRWRYDLPKSARKRLEAFMELSDKEIITLSKGGEFSAQTISGEQLQKMREARGYTQYKLAQKIGVSSSTVGRWEANGGVTREYMAIVCGIFDIPYTDVRKRNKKTEKKWKAEQAERKKLLNKLDILYDGELSQAPDDCPVLNEFRKLVGA